ncbi:MAG TPA: hypothetical protein VJS67_08680 [Pseudonocardiaceae bacterium]|nr:hypothetical protein [Pseudonocardiaceae bacterium]
MTGFSIELPEGFIELPAAPATAEVQHKLEKLLGLPAGDTSAAEVAKSLSVLGALAADSGAQYSSIGLFRSPDDLQRPVSVVLTASRMTSEHDDASTVITGLREVYAADLDTDTEVLQLPAGQALATIREQPLMLQVDGVAPVALLQRQVVVWIPDRAGSAVAVVGVASNCWQDWPHVCDLALDLFESVSWTP